MCGLQETIVVSLFGSCLQVPKNHALLNCSKSKNYKERNQFFGSYSYLKGNRKYQVKEICQFSNTNIL